jgi:predicted DCC family thiol-disulfide oxidoreductase YuxK
MLILYSTSHCHLCEEALKILNHFSQTHTIEYKIVEITDDDILLNHYGTRIPVIQNTTTKQEINWPFNMRDLLLIMT